jgi:colicin import membrane protein
VEAAAKAVVEAAAEAERQRAAEAAEAERQRLAEAAEVARQRAAIEAEAEAERLSLAAQRAAEEAEAERQRLAEEAAAAEAARIRREELAGEARARIRELEARVEAQAGDIERKQSHALEAEVLMEAVTLEIKAHQQRKAACTNSRAQELRGQLEVLEAGALELKIMRRNIASEGEEMKSIEGELRVFVKGKGSAMVDTETAVEIENAAHALREQNAGTATRRQARLGEAQVEQREVVELLRAKQAQVVERRRGEGEGAEWGRGGGGEGGGRSIVV